MKIFSIYGISLFFLLGCNELSSKSDCLNPDNAKELSFLSDTIKLMLPSLWEKSDTTLYYDKASVYNRRIMNNDTSCVALISVSDYGVYPNVRIDSETFFLRMKAKMKELNGGQNRLISDVVKEVNGHEINFLKYLHTENNVAVYDAHIGFIMPEKKQVEIQLRIAKMEDTDADKLVDCIFQSLRIK